MVEPKLGEGTNWKAQMLCTWGAPVAMFGWFIGWLVLTGFIPPLDPTDTAQQTADIFASRPNMIRAGLVVTMTFALLIAPFFAVLSQQLKRIEGKFSVFADLQLCLGVVDCMIFIMPCWALGTASFRPERNPELIQLMNDFGWLPFVGMYQFSFWQWLAVALAMFKDKEEKVFPRWVAWFNLWCVVLTTPASFVLFFKTGPFAWNGLLAFWLLVVVFCGWFFVMFFPVRKAIRGQEAEWQAAQAAQVAQSG